MYAKVNGADIYYIVEGEGFPIMTFHGGLGLGDHSDAKSYFKPLTKYFKFIHFDHRGGGLSSKHPPNEYTHERFIDDAEGLRRFLNLGRVVIFGGSYGGFLALEYTLKYQENVERLILRATAARKDHMKDGIENALKANIPGINREKLEKCFSGDLSSNEEFKEIFSNLFPLYSTKLKADELKKYLDKKRFFYETHNAVFTNCFPNYDITSALHEIKVETLILAGAKDWITPPEYSEEMNRLIPNSRLEQFKNAGHSIHVDEYDRFLQAIEVFLDDLK